MDKTFLLRVFSVKEDREAPIHDPQDPQAQQWEVRADADSGTPRASVFYMEHSPRQLPKLNSLIRVRIDEQLTTAEDTAPRE